MSELPETGDSRPSDNPPEEESRGWFTRFLDLVEWLGNLLPHPVTLFAIFAASVVLLSGVAEWLEWSAQDPRPPGAPGRAADGIIEPISLLNGEGLRQIVVNLVNNFTSFPPLWAVLGAMLGGGETVEAGRTGGCR